VEVNKGGRRGGREGGIDHDRRVLVEAGYAEKTGKKRRECIGGTHRGGIAMK
jgi:hypothetical protein